MIGKPQGPAYLFGALLFIWLSLALALTPAGTEIRNQASATYVDSAGQPRTTTSNLVVTVVQQVYSFTITPNGDENNPGQTRSGLPGSQVLFSYQVTNTGNGTDTIKLSTSQGATDPNTGDNFDLNNVEIFQDANCNGNLDAGETTPITSVTLAMDESACVIVRGTIPTTQTSGNANVNLVGTSQARTPDNPDDDVTDNNNWARATATTAAVLTAFKSASPSGSVPPGGTITYTVSGSNTGGSAAAGVSVNVDGSLRTGILIADTIPNGLTVKSIDTTNSNASAGTVRFVYTNDRTRWETISDPGNFGLEGDGTKAIGMFIEGSGAFFPQTASYTFSFEATVRADAALGTLYTNAATVHFNDGQSAQTVTTNSTTNTVGASYGVAVGPYEHPEAGASGTYTVGDYTVTRSGDAQTIASVKSGTTVIFRHTLRNTGNTSDSFNLSFSGVPAGWICSLVANDLTTPINGSVGPVQAREDYRDYNFALRCQVPAGATGGPFTITVTATSVGDPNQSDSTTDKVDSVTPGYTVDAAHNTNDAPGEQLSDPDNDTRLGYNPAVNPGGVAPFPFEVKNTGANPDTYTFTASVPSGWTVVFYPDANCDGKMDTPTPNPVINTGLVNPNDIKCFIAAVRVPASAAPVDVTPGTNDNVQFTVTSTTPSTVSDTIFGAVDVNLVNQIALVPNRAGTVTSPGIIEYTHILTNNSDASATCTLSGSGGSYGWTYQYSTDGSTWAPRLSEVTVPAGSNQTIYVRVLVPAGEPIGRTDVNTLNATCEVNGQNHSLPAATETTTVLGGDLRLSKSAKTYDSQGNVRSQNGSQAYPGDTIEYTVVAGNIGTGDLKKVIIIDPLPIYTDFVSVSATTTDFPAGATVLYSTDGTTWSPNPPTSLSLGQSIYVAVDTSGDGNITDADVMPPGAKITLTFKVKVQ